MYPHSLPNQTSYVLSGKMRPTTGDVTNFRHSEPHNDNHTNHQNTSYPQSHHGVYNPNADYHSMVPANISTMNKTTQNDSDNSAKNLAKNLTKKRRTKPKIPSKPPHSFKISCKMLKGVYCIIPIHDPTFLTTDPSTPHQSSPHPHQAQRHFQHTQHAQQLHTTRATHALDLSLLLNVLSTKNFPLEFALDEEGRLDLDYTTESERIISQSVVLDGLEQNESGNDNNNSNDNNNNNNNYRQRSPPHSNLHNSSPPNSNQNNQIPLTVITRIAPHEPLTLITSVALLHDLIEKNPKTILTLILIQVLRPDVRRLI